MAKVVLREEIITKLSLPLKLSIFVVLLFSAVIAVCLMWTPVKLRYYTAKLNSNDPKERVAGVDGLLEMGERGKELLTCELNGGEEAASFLAMYWGKLNEVVVYKAVERWQSPGFDTFTGRSPLSAAICAGYKDIVVLFVHKGSDVNGNRTEPESPITLAVKNGFACIVELLIEKGAELNAKDNMRYTPLHLAIENGNLEVAKLLIEKGADVNTQADGVIRSGDTPLICAAKKGYVDIVSLLISKGADVNTREGAFTAYDSAKTPEIKKLLQAHGGMSGRIRLIEEGKK